MIPPRPDGHDTNAWLARGRALIEQREPVLEQVDLLYAVLPALESYVEHVRNVGTCCATGCDESFLEADGMGRPVCFRTRRPCPNVALRAIVELWESL